MMARVNGRGSLGERVAPSVGTHAAFAARGHTRAPATHCGNSAPNRPVGRWRTWSSGKIPQRGTAPGTTRRSCSPTVPPAGQGPASVTSRMLHRLGATQDQPSSNTSGLGGVDFQRPIEYDAPSRARPTTLRSRTWRLLTAPTFHRRSRRVPK